MTKVSALAEEVASEYESSPAATFAAGQSERRPVLRPEEVGEGGAIAGPGRLDEVGPGLPEQHSLDYLCNQ